MVTQPQGANRDEDPRRTQNSRLLEQLIASHGSLLRHQAAKHSQRPSDAEDALHDSYALFIERYHGRLPALPYLMTTIKPAPGPSPAAPIVPASDPPAAQ